MKHIILPILVILGAVIPNIKSEIPDWFPGKENIPPDQLEGLEDGFMEMNKLVNQFHHHSLQPKEQPLHVITWYSDIKKDTFYTNLDMYHLKIEFSETDCMYRKYINFFGNENKKWKQDCNLRQPYKYYPCDVWLLWTPPKWELNEFSCKPIRNKSKK